MFWAGFLHPLTVTDYYKGLVSLQLCFKFPVLRPGANMAGFSCSGFMSGRALVNPFSPDPCAVQGEMEAQGRRDQLQWLLRGLSPHVAGSQPPSHSSLLAQAAVDFVRQGGPQTLKQHQSTPELQERVQGLLDMALQLPGASVFSSSPAASSAFS